MSYDVRNVSKIVKNGNYSYFKLFSDLFPFSLNVFSNLNRLEKSKKWEPVEKGKLSRFSRRSWTVLNFQVELVRQKIVSPSVRPSVRVCVTPLLEGLAGRIFLKFGMVMKNRKIGRITEPDFRFWILILILRTLRVENGHFSCISAIISKTSHKIFLKFWYVVVLDVVHLLKKTACPGKF